MPRKRVKEGIHQAKGNERRHRERSVEAVFQDSTLCIDWTALWDTTLPSGWSLEKELGSDHLIFSIATSGELLIMGGLSASLTVIDTRSWETLHELHMDDTEAGVVYSLLVMQNEDLSQQLVVGTEDGYITVWDMEAWECLNSMAAHSEPVLCLAHPAVTQLASASADGTIILWSCEWDSQQTLYSHEGEVAVLEAAQGYLFSAGDDCVLRVWSKDHGGWWDCETELDGHHDKPIITAAVLNISMLVTCDRDGKAIMWEIGTWELKSSFEMYTGPVWALKLGDQLIVNGNINGDVKVWRHDEGALTLEEQVENLIVGDE